MISNLRLFLIQYQLLIYWTKPKNPKSIYVEKEANEIHFVLKFYLIDHTESIFQKPIDRKYRESHAFNIFSFPRARELS